MHRITPIFKAGDRMSVKNYRPISLLCNVSKVLERLIFDKVSPFVTRQITMSQFGFLHNHSSEGIDKLCQHNFENYRQPGAFWIYEGIIGSLDVKVAIRMRTTQVQFY